MNKFKVIKRFETKPKPKHKQQNRSKSNRIENEEKTLQYKLCPHLRHLSNYYIGYNLFQMEVENQ